MSKYKSFLNVLTHSLYGIVVVLSAVIEVVDKILSK